jgi:hypothetical protein
MHLTSLGAFYTIALPFDVCFARKCHSWQEVGSGLPLAFLILGIRWNLNRFS